MPRQTPNRPTAFRRFPAGIPVGNSRSVRQWTEDLTARLDAHRQGRGARLMEVIAEAGLGFVLARTWTGTRALERRLKGRGGHARLCPICRQSQGGTQP